MRSLIMFVAAMSLAGCAAPTLYKWGDYDQALYAGYKDQTKMDELRLKLEVHVGQMERQSQKVAPGLYAELGTLYLQGGSPDKAITMYARERDAWPESKTLMTSMIQNLERRSSTRPEAAK